MLGGYGLGVTGIGRFFFGGGGGGWIWGFGGFVLRGFEVEGVKGSGDLGFTGSGVQGFRV